MLSASRRLAAAVGAPTVQRAQGNRDCRTLSAIGTPLCRGLRASRRAGSALVGSRLNARGVVAAASQGEQRVALVQGTPPPGGPADRL